MSVLAGRSVLVTGGSGSFGHAFVKYALAHGASRVAVYSRDELKQSVMRRAIPDERLRLFVGDIRDRDRLGLAMRGVHDVVHAGAMKRIEVCEQEPWEAVATNIIGTENVARACMGTGVERAIFLSSDKAAEPSSLYGLTKGTGERLWCQANAYSAGTVTRFTATRYGNVVGSRGSVLELWRRQKAAGEPLTVTHEFASRFWMPMSVAVELVVTALREMRSGEIFVPRIGSASVLDLARAVAEPPMYLPGHRLTGLLPAEKLHEVLVTADEARHTYDAGTHYIIEPESRTWGDVEPRALPKVPEGFEYRSDLNEQQLTIDQLREMI